MKTLSLAWALLLATYAAPARADDLFSQNPYECVFAARTSVADDATRRHNLADCMVRVVDTAQALRALESANFQFDYTARREIERKMARGERWYARALLSDMITGREQTPARVEQLKAGAMADAREQKINACLSNPEQTSSSRDRACSDVPGFRNSTGRVNRPDAEHPTEAAMHERAARRSPKS